MRLSWNEVRARAAAFAEDWRDAAFKKGETQSFYNDFFAVFGVQRRSVARYEEHVKKLDERSGFIDLFWPGVLIVEQKSAGRDLDKAYGQAGDYFDALPERERPRYISDERLPESRRARPSSLISHVPCGESALSNPLSTMCLRAQLAAFCQRGLPSLSRGS